MQSLLPAARPFAHHGPSSSYNHHPPLVPPIPPRVPAEKPTSLAQQTVSPQRPRCQGPPPLLPSADSSQDPGSKRGFYQAPAETSRKQLVSASNFPRSTSNKFFYLLKTLPSRFCPALVLPCCPAMPGPQTGSSHPPFPLPARSAIPSSSLDKPHLAGGSAGGH